jgi:hypothetical protein
VSTQAVEIRAALARWRADRMSFRREAIVLEDGRRFGDVIEAWQAEDFAALDAPAHRHAYLERPRGHSKTGDAGTEIRRVSCSTTSAASFSGIRSWPRW